MDIAKYIITAVIISSFFSGIHEEKLVYMGGGIVAAITVTVGLYLQKETSSKKKRRNY
jgi:hypothetical protein